MGLEVKTAKGKISDVQQEFARALEAAGGRYEIVRNLDDVIALGL
jgi:hypothetical protein